MEVVSIVTGDCYVGGEGVRFPCCALPGRYMHDV